MKIATTEWKALDCKKVITVSHHAALLWCTNACKFKVVGIKGKPVQRGPKHPVFLD